MEVKWIEHQERKIVYVDFRGARNGEDLLTVLYQFADLLKRSPGKVLSLLNFENVYPTTGFMSEAKKLGKEIGLEKMGKSAYIGVTGLKNVLFQAYLRFTGQGETELFDTEEKAKDWLVS